MSPKKNVKHALAKTEMDRLSRSNQASANKEKKRPPNKRKKIAEYPPRPIILDVAADFNCNRHASQTKT